jgi:hypothetical protein
MQTARRRRERTRATANRTANSRNALPASTIGSGPAVPLAWLCVIACAALGSIESMQAAAVANFVFTR